MPPTGTATSSEVSTKSARRYTLVSGMPLLVLVLLLPVLLPGIGIPP